MTPEKFQSLRTLQFNENVPEAEFIQYINEQYLIKLFDMGFTLQGYNHLEPKQPDLAGVHILQLEQTDENKGYTVKQIEELLTDDDGQPMSTYSLFLGSLIIFIPYYI